MSRFYNIIILVGLIMFSVTAFSKDKILAKPEQKNEDSTKIELQDNRIVVYYFYQTKRCVSCKKIEAFTTEAVTANFADKIEKGRLEWILINVDHEENQHYFDDYELFTKSVIVSRLVEGKETDWINLSKIWELLGDKDKFIDYIDSEIKSFAAKK